MTVETTTNKMPAQVMGTLLEYPFTFKALTIDDTEEIALQAIKATVFNTTTENETELIYGDMGDDGYSVSIDSNGTGGTITVNDIRTSSDQITIYRVYNEKQTSDYKDFDSFPAETLERNIDKLTMLVQQQSEEIDRCIKPTITSSGVDYTLPLAEASTIIGYNSDGDGMTNYTAIPETALDTGTFSDTEVPEWDNANTRLTGSGILSTDITVQGNTFNGNSQLVQLNSSGQLPAIDGSLLTGIGGGVTEFSELGEVTTNITLDKNIISMAYFSGSTTVTLPTVSGEINRVECILDFTTDSTAYPTIVNNVNLTGTIAVTNGDATITGTTTEFTTELNVGDTIIIESVEYYVDTIASDTSLELSVVYAGSNDSGLTAYRKILKWSDNNNGVQPLEYSILAGTRNKLTFKNYWENSIIYWEAEYSTYGAVEIPFTRPDLSANGTLGGANYAVYASFEYAAGNAAYKAADSDLTGTYWMGNTTAGDSYIFYNPEGLKLSALNITTGPSERTTDAALYGSNDNSTYIFIQNLTGMTSANTTYPFNVNSTSFYKYHKIVSTAISTRCAHADVTPIATYLAT